MFKSSLSSPAARHEADTPANPLLIIAMAALCAIGYWSNHHFEDLRQGVEWCVDTAESDASPGA